MTSLWQLAFTVPQAQARNVAYNAICLLYKVIQGFDAEDMTPDRTRIVLCEHLVEYRRNVILHCVGVQSTCSCEMTTSGCSPRECHAGLSLPAQ
jgi:hypothetical protein